MPRNHSITVVSCIFVLLIVGESQAAPAGATCPEVKTNRRGGPPTTSTLVTGRGFEAGETVDLTFDQAPLTKATTDPSGGFGIRVRIPASARPGRHEIQATGEVSGLRAAAGFLVQTNWAMFRFGPARTGYNPRENVLNPSNVSGLRLAWRYSPGPAAVESSPPGRAGVLAGA